MKTKTFINKIVEQTNNDYSQAFKLLGLILFIAQEGNESLLSGEMISPRTYYRWAKKIDRAGYGNLLVEARLRQVLSEYINNQLGDLTPNETNEKVCEVVERSLNKIHS